MDMTAKDPALRPGSAAEVAARAVQIRDGVLPAARLGRAPRPGGRAGRFGARDVRLPGDPLPGRAPYRRGLLAAIFGLAVLVAGVVAWQLTGLSRPQRVAAPAASSPAMRPDVARTVRVTDALVGQPVSAVQRALRAHGLRVQVQPQPDRLAAPGTVLRVSPTGRLAIGHLVLLTVAVRPSAAASSATSSQAGPTPPTAAPGNVPPGRAKHGKGPHPATHATASAISRQPSILKSLRVPRP